MAIILKYDTLKAGIGKILPYIIPYLILLGVAKQMMYYRAFGVNILPYLQFTECLTVFLDDIILLILFLLMALFVVSIVKWIDTKTKSPDNLPIRGTRNLYFIIYLILLLIALIPDLITYYSSSYLSTTLFYFLLFIVVYYGCLYSNRIVDDLPMGARIVSFLALFWLVWVLFSGRVDYHKIIARKNYNGVIIQFDSSIIKSDSTLYYIGQTGNYIFMYNQKERNTIIYPMNRVKVLFFPNKRTDAPK